MAKEIMDYDEAAEYLDYKKSTLYNKVSARAVPHSRINQRKVLFIKKDLDAWLDKKKFTPEEPEALLLRSA